MQLNGDRSAVQLDVAAERAREALERYGEHAGDYVESRIEASRTSGESGDVAMWRRVSELVSRETED
jgi:hypothetical protein